MSIQFWMNDRSRGREDGHELIRSSPPTTMCARHDRRMRVASLRGIRGGTDHRRQLGVRRVRRDESRAAARGRAADLARSDAGRERLRARTVRRRAEQRGEPAGLDRAHGTDPVHRTRRGERVVDHPRCDGGRCGHDRERARSAHRRVAADEAADDRCDDHHLDRQRRRLVRCAHRKRWRAIRERAGGRTSRRRARDRRRPAGQPGAARHARHPHSS